ncbi:CPBP family intramembrane glutamic endopeptidase [Paenibacillus lutrae]|uniref:CPBP family intramembrane metalloprotease n=1 Tax=Paenibacillus lutrae TaxID=2078573 RepID=A0A7X3JYJ4_9BACL|nr:type II CAAX endopeptidase family protein [Paenibacillus lutrae]MVO99032.1 CPBP family intramembrane metalloprotease [Paenibacillus lutrae]
MSKAGLAAGPPRLGPSAGGQAGAAAGFVGAMLLVQLTPAWAGLTAAALLIGLALFQQRAGRILLLTIASILTGYWLSAWLGAWLRAESLTGFAEPARIALSRLGLIGYVIPLSLLYICVKPDNSYLAAGRFGNIIYFPLVWRGIKDPVWRSLLISSAVVTVSFLFVIDFGQDRLLQILGYSVLFAGINAALEEVVWRGYLLSRLVDLMGELKGVLVCSAAFGFYHYSIGFPWAICILFGVLGIWLSGLAIRAQGLLPVFLLHFVMNILFGLSGMIF